MGDAVPALISQQSTLEGPELMFDLAEDSHFGVPFILLQLLLLGILAFEFLCQNMTVTLAEFK